MPGEIKPRRKWPWVLGSLIVIGALNAVSGLSQAPRATYVHTTPPPFDAEIKANAEKREAIDLTALTAIHQLRDAMHDPRSFELVQVLQMKSGALCITYRAVNGFNAVRTNHAVVDKDRVYGGNGTSAFIDRWNRLCGNKSGDDLSHLRRAL